MPPSHKKIIFVVDDSVPFLRICERMLNRAGYHVVTAPDGAFALQVLAQTSSIDLLLCDIIMPEKGGLEVIRTVRAKFPRIPIIAMSGGGALTHCVTLGAQAVLTKPFTEQELTAAVTGVLGPAK